MDPASIGLILTGVVLPLIGWAIRTYAAAKKDELAASERERLEKTAALAVRAAEEGGAKKTPAQKYGLAFEAFEILFPDHGLQPSTITMLLHAALQAAGLGASGKAGGRPRSK